MSDEATEFEFEFTISGRYKLTAEEAMENYGTIDPDEVERLEQRASPDELFDLTRTFTIDIWMVRS